MMEHPTIPCPQKSHSINAVNVATVGSLAPAPRGSHRLTWECIYKVPCARAWGHGGSARQILSVRKATCHSECGLSLFRRMAQVLCSPPEFCCYLLMQLCAHVSASQCPEYIRARGPGLPLCPQRLAHCLATR